MRSLRRRWLTCIVVVWLDVKNDVVFPKICNWVQLRYDFGLVTLNWRNNFGFKKINWINEERTTSDWREVKFIIFEWLGWKSHNRKENDFHCLLPRWFTRLIYKTRIINLKEIQLRRQEKSKFLLNLLRASTNAHSIFHPRMQQLQNAIEFFSNGSF